MIYFFLLLLFSFLSLFPAFSNSSLFHTHDGLVHLARIAAYYKAFSDHQIPIRWAGDLNYGYGMPLFNFIYQLPYFFSALLISFGFGLKDSFKIVLLSSYILSGAFIFLFAKSFLKDNKKAFFISILYQFAPFRLIELLVRGSFGEVYTYVFFPLVLFGVTKLNKKLNFNFFLLTAISSALLILSHNALSLVFFCISAIFIFIFSKDRKVMFISFASIIAGLLIAAFYWLPAIFEHKYTYGDLFMKDVYKKHFPPLLNFFIPNFFNNSYFQTGGISTQFGIFHTAAIFISLALLVFKRKIDVLTKKIILFSLFLTFLSLFFMQPFSKLFWEKISLLRQFQFPWRFLALTNFSTSLLGISFFSFSIFKKKVFYIVICTLVVISTISYWNPPLGFDKIDEKDYWNYPLTTTYFGETDVIWSSGPAKAYPKQRIEVIDGDGIVANFTKTSNSHSFEVNAFKKVKLVDHTEYFPGWRVYVDQTVVPIQFQSGNYRGEMIYSVPKGKHFVKAVFGESKIRAFADMLTISSIFGLITLQIIFLFKHEKK